jgi:hypothetical protein
MINLRGSCNSHNQSIISPLSINWDVAVMETRCAIRSSHGDLLECDTVYSGGSCQYVQTGGSSETQVHYLISEFSLRQELYSYLLDSI